MGARPRNLAARSKLRRPKLAVETSSTLMPVSGCRCFGNGVAIIATDRGLNSVENRRWGPHRPYGSPIASRNLVEDIGVAI
jgi:hypothetical protein